jgi:nitroreductase
MIAKEAMICVTQALKQRVSIRQFLPEALSKELVTEILEAARWAPSGGNLQPWRVIVVSGAERAAVTSLARGSFANGHVEADDRPVYPPHLWEPYRTRRFKLGEDMYALLGIPRSDRPARLARWDMNYEFFGAPVGLFFVIDERMGHAQWAHLGMLIQSVALAAFARGLGTCMQEAWSALRTPLKRHFQLQPAELVYCGMALGRADPAAAVNRLRSERMEVEELATFLGFD